MTHFQGLHMSVHDEAQERGHINSIDMVPEDLQTRVCALLYTLLVSKSDGMDD